MKQFVVLLATLIVALVAASSAQAAVLTAYTPTPYPPGAVTSTVYRTGADMSKTYLHFGNAEYAASIHAGVNCKTRWGLPQSTLYQAARHKDWDARHHATHVGFDLFIFFKNLRRYCRYNIAVMGPDSVQGEPFTSGPFKTPYAVWFDRKGTY